MKKNKLYSENTFCWSKCVHIATLLTLLTQADKSNVNRKLLVLSFKNSQSGYTTIVHIVDGKFCSIFK